MCFPSKNSTCNKYEIIPPIILHWVLHWKILDVHVIKNKYCKYMHAHTLQQMKASLKYMYSYINVYIYIYISWIFTKLSTTNMLSAISQNAVKAFYRTPAVITHHSKTSSYETRRIVWSEEWQWLVRWRTPSG